MPLLFNLSFLPILSDDVLNRVGRQSLQLRFKRIVSVSFEVLSDKRWLVVAIHEWDFFNTIQDALEFFLWQRHSFSQKVSQIGFILYRNLIVFVSEVEHWVVNVYLGHVFQIADWIDHFRDALVLQFQVYHGERWWKLELFLVGWVGGTTRLGFLVDIWDGRCGDRFNGNRYGEIDSLAIDMCINIVCDSCLLCYSKERLSVTTVLPCLDHFLFSAVHWELLCYIGAFGSCFGPGARSLGCHVYLL